MADNKILKNIYQELVVLNLTSIEEKQIQRHIFQLEDEIKQYDPDDENPKWKSRATQLRAYQKLVDKQGCSSLFVIKDEGTWED